MKRNERTTLNHLKKTVNENTIRVEVPADFSLEARQAIHELLTIEKHMIAVGYYWDPVTDEERVNYIKAWEDSESAQRERMAQEITPIEEVEEGLAHHEYAWTGHRKPAEEEEQPAAEITQEDLDEAVSETISQAAEDEDEEIVEKAAKCVGEGNGYYKEEILRKFLAALREAREAVKSGSDLALRVSDRNNKMGKIPSVSTLPFLTCPSTCRNTCGKICYAAKLANLRPAVLHSYAINTALATLRPDMYWQQVRTVLAVSRFFRFHVSGDVINRAYLDEMISAALSAPHCEILVFTKRYNLVNAWIDENGDLPANLHVLFSGWEDLTPENPHGLPETQVYGRKEEPDPSWLLCGGECDSCACRGLGCWQAKRGDVIAFRKH